MSDLFGNPMAPSDWEDKPRTMIRRILGPYNYRPSADPGRRCATCSNHFVKTHSKRYHKCALLRCSSSIATDIRARNVCDRWEAADERRP